MKLIINLIDIISTGREKNRYEALLNNPEERERSVRFGKKSIISSCWAILLSLAAFGFAMIGNGLGTDMQDTSLASGFQLILFIVCAACAAVLILIAIIYYLSRLKYIKWQRTLNARPIKNAALIVAIVAIAVILVLAVLSVVFLMKPFANS